MEIGRRSDTYDTVYIKDNNSVAVSSGIGDKQCITIINIERKEVMTTISIDTLSYGMAVRGATIFYCARENGLKMLTSHSTSRDVYLLFQFQLYILN
jgi:hypothetical protein